MPKIAGFTIAVINMSLMLSFYSDLLQVQFEPELLASYTVYNADWNGIKIQLCPAELANNSAEQNRHQLIIEVNDIKGLLQQVIAKGGKLMGEVSENDGIYSVSVYDPDNNSLVLRQNK